MIAAGKIRSIIDTNTVKAYKVKSTRRGKRHFFISGNEYNTFTIYARQIGFCTRLCWAIESGIYIIISIHKKSPLKIIRCKVKNPTFAVLKLGYMLAVVKIAGQQFKVKAGDNLYVPHIEGNSGDSVEFAEVLMTDNAGTVTLGSDVKAVVKAQIITGLVQGDKVIAFKMKRRKGFRKKHGHRTHYTKIQVTEIA